MLTSKYMSSVKNVPAIMQKIITGTAPERFTTEYLKNIGFKGSNDRAIITVLKELGFLSADGTPMPRYHDYRNSARSRKVLGDSLKEAYSDLFHINAKPTNADRKAIEGMFKSTHNVSDDLAARQAMTFFAFLDLADISEESSQSGVNQLPKVPEEIKSDNGIGRPVQHHLDTLSLRYNIEIHLPATTDISVYNAIFKSLKENLVD